MHRLHFHPLTARRNRLWLGLHLIERSGHTNDTHKRIGLPPDSRKTFIHAYTIGEYEKIYQTMELNVTILEYFRCAKGLKGKEYGFTIVSKASLSQPCTERHDIRTTNFEVHSPGKLYTLILRVLNQ